MQSPQINGNYYSFANIEFRVNGLFILGIKSINYGNKVGSTFVRGTNQMPLGTTQGQYEPKCDIEILRPQFNLFLAAAGNGYMAELHDYRHLWQSARQRTPPDRDRPHRRREDYRRRPEQQRRRRSVVGQSDVLAFANPAKRRRRCSKRVAANRVNRLSH